MITAGPFAVWRAVIIEDQGGNFGAKGHLDWGTGRHVRRPRWGLRSSESIGRELL